MRTSNARIKQESHFTSGLWFRLPSSYKTTKEFSKRVQDYKEKRDIPSLDGTSKMSLFLKNGSVSSSQILAILELTSHAKLAHPSNYTYVNEIIWREFYYAILYHQPSVENTSFREEYSSLQWQGKREHFEKWKSGETGFPIVDAGMRQLNTTGWMHNG